MADSKKDKTQLLVLGAGPGGYAAAFRAADLGIDVTLVDRRAEPGGVCLHEGCIPSKTLLHAARVIHEADEADAWGIHFSQPRIDIDKLRSFSSDVIGHMTGGLRSLCKSRGVNYLQGTGRFTDAHHVKVEGEATREIEFEHAIIATGSRAVPMPPGVDADLEEDSPALMTAGQALSLPDVPQRLLVVGGGYIGLEMGTVYAALGSRVTLIELTDGLLPGVDRDLVKPLHQRVEKHFEQIMLRTRVTQMKRYRQGVEVVLESADGQSHDRRFQKVLVAVGRQPNTDKLNLDEAGLKTDKRGFIAVDGQRRTAVEHLFAIGDVAGEPMLAHKATHEGRVAAEVIAGEPAEYAPHAVPAVVFTDPQIAWAGLTEHDAKEQGVEVRIARFPWKASGRAKTLDRTEGVTKLIVQPRTGRILGVGITGVEAGELIGEAVLAIEAGMTAAELAQSIHAHPTLSETIMEAAQHLDASSTHLPRGA